MSRLGIALMALCSAFAGCRERGDQVSTLTVRDSAGIRIVENGLVEDRMAPWRIAEEPLFRVGWEEGDPQFIRIMAGAAFPDGRIAVSDRDRVVVLSSSGEFLYELGTRGSGPGEFDEIASLLPLGGDTLALDDQAANRITLFVGRALELARSWPDQTWERRFLLAGRTRSGAFYRTRVNSADGIGLGDQTRAFPGWYQVPVLRISSDFQAADTVALLDAVLVSEEVSPFLYVGLHTVTGSSVLYVRADVPEVRWLDEDGSTLQIARWNGEEGDHPGEVWARNIRGDDKGNAWVNVEGGRAPSRSGARSWWVMTSDGRWLGRVNVPQDIRPLYFGSDIFLGVDFNQLRVEAVVVYRIEKVEG